MRSITLRMFLARPQFRSLYPICALLAADRMEAHLRERRGLVRHSGELCP